MDAIARKALRDGKGVDKNLVGDVMVKNGHTDCILYHREVPCQCVDGYGFYAGMWNAGGRSEIWSLTFEQTVMDEGR